MKRTPQLTGTGSPGNRHTAGLRCLGKSRGRSRRKVYRSQQPSPVTDPKPPLWRKWGRKECLMRCVVITQEGASPPRPQPTTHRAPFSHSALTGSQREPAGARCMSARDVQGHRWGPWMPRLPGPRAAKCRRWGVSGGTDADCNLPALKNPELKGCVRKRKQEVFYGTLCISHVKSSIFGSFLNDNKEGTEL